MVREFPSGMGFADIVFLPRKESAKGAISQINNKEYVQALEKYSGDILLVGINYSRKTKKHSCIIEKYNKPAE